MALLDIEVSTLRRKESETSQVWWVASFPLWFSFSCFVLLGFGRVSPLAILILAAYVPASLVALVVLAFRDRDALSRAGFGTSASPLWMFLTPVVYLLARAIVVGRERKDGAFVPLITFGSLLLLVSLFALTWIGIDGLTHPTR